MNILIVDHSKVFRTVVEKAVAGLGHQPFATSSAEEALDVLREQHIDLICAALSLPGMNGIALCHQVRGRPDSRDIPFILVSSTDDKHLRQEAFEAGVTEIQGKADSKELIARLSRFFTEEREQISGRVLYIEDSNVAAHVMIKMLHEMNLSVDHFRNADDALAAFEKNNYDLIISDILLEGAISGVGLVQRVRNYVSDKRRVPILALSGLDEPTRRIELFKLGVNDYVTKPPIEEEVRARVRNLVLSKQLFDQVESQSRQLYNLAMRDQLTGLYNRNSLKEFAPRYFREADDMDVPLSLLVVDLDHFKAINDTHGHMIGDNVLAAMGEMMKRIMREGDLAARLGGEEFVLILNHCDADEAMRRAESIRKAIAILKPEGIDITASIGIVTRPRGKIVQFEDMFKVADRAVYEAKNQGRNRVTALPYDG
ncbi:MAG TPA: diguanylate cyclase [Gammaproteobacteria bacterium]|nr:diguanylate cyclase [Gammaproteobacteria bacterium]